MFVALDLFGGEGERITVFQHYASVAEGLDAVFRALGIQHDGDGQIELFAHALDGCDFFGVFFVRTVGKIEARHIHAGESHLREHFFGFAGRADRADNFRLFHRILQISNFSPFLF